MRLQPVRERLDALREQEGGVRGEDRADVAQLLRAEPGEERVLAEVAGPVEAAVARDRLVEQREPGAVPVEQAGLDYDSAEAQFVPSMEVSLDADQASRVVRLVEALEDLDDVQNVFGNFDIPDEVLETLDA